MSKDTLIVGFKDESFECHKEGAVGMYNLGRGKTVAEAVGDYCIFSGTVRIRCDPPKLLKQYQAKKVKKFKPCPNRED